MIFVFIFTALFNFAVSVIVLITFFVNVIIRQSLFVSLTYFYKKELLYWKYYNKNNKLSRSIHIVLSLAVLFIACVYDHKRLKSVV